MKEITMKLDFGGSYADGADYKLNLLEKFSSTLKADWMAYRIIGWTRRGFFMIKGW